MPRTTHSKTQHPKVGTSEQIGSTTLFCGSAGDFYERWEAPTVIHVDGPYGVSGFPGDPHTADGLAKWYAPHAAAWASAATPETTLWFWGTEIGWALVHPVLDQAGWEYEGLQVWDKGIAHVAGNVNSRTIRGFPVVTEVCARYSRRATFESEDGALLSMKEWLRSEWLRSGLPLYKTNEACGVKNAATRKYFTQDHLWYFPPPEMMAKLAAYAKTNGRLTKRPYFSLDGATPLTAERWAHMRTKWNHEHGVTNVWAMPAIRGAERIKHNGKIVHTNQKPLALIERLINATSDEGDVVWDPFAGLATTGVAANRLGRRCYTAEITPTVATAAAERLRSELAVPTDLSELA
ncbi:site-specific DNA-methyltransferase (adenine-specific) [Jatrophihabitans endophyticus]|uniref:Site-specific DNA-methyltransferase (Adenine-specific) n=1 Tax=Jatrophihabitans endophyticus TaxID=1206085 RepID=A0A1M5HCX6_9ACTN|nr:site-specific DNA-methyltransferase [Jatrophihabitans endophyticus]SHG13738.1 site-specific DNA-methyltransferase (adenine-specific) [Jatrophihabitans endophyticus]